MSDFYVPKEILVEIFKRLPVKSLVRFAIVSKSWYALITSPTFVAVHLTHNRKNPSRTAPLFIRHFSKQDQREHYTIHHIDTNSNNCKNSELFFPLNSRMGYVRIVGCCNGLVCVSGDLFSVVQSSIYLWNPSIHEHITLPPPAIVPKSAHISVLGFGAPHDSFDVVKVVRIVYEKMGCLEQLTVPPQVEVYTTGAGLWRKPIASVNIECELVEFMWTQALINGFVHWVAFKRRGGNGIVVRSLVLRFDLGDELFSEMEFPDDLVNELPTNLYVTVVMEKFGVIQYDRAALDVGRCFVWVMEEYGVAESWTRIYGIQLVGLERVIGFRNTDEVFISLASGELLEYNPKTMKGKDFGIVGAPRSFFLDTYMESLILIKRQNRFIEVGRQNYYDV